MSITSTATFGFGQAVTGGARNQLGGKGPGKETEKKIIVNNTAELRRTLIALANPGTTKTFILLANNDYDFGGETADNAGFTIKAQNLTFQALTSPGNVRLNNLGLILDLASTDNIVIRNLSFHSDGSTGPNDAIVLDASTETESSGSATTRVRITHCAFDGYKDQAIEIRTRYSRLLATIDHCYFFDSNPGEGDFTNRGAINVASVILDGGVRTAANSYVTAAYNYFENVWRRSPRAAADGTHVHAFNNLLYRWGYQKDGVTSTPSWNGMEVELDPHQADQPEKVVMAVFQANRYIPWESKQNKAIDHDAGTQVDIAKSTTLANRFDKPSGESGNSILEPDGTFQTIDVDAWYTGLKGPDGTSLGYVAPPVTPTGEVDWVVLARSAGPTMRAASIPNEVSADPGE